VHNKFWKASNSLARKAKEGSVYLIDFSSRRTIVIVVWAENNVV
jgi:hypothetical protein